MKLKSPDQIIKIITEEIENYMTGRIIGDPLPKLILPKEISEFIGCDFKFLKNNPNLIILFYSYKYELVSTLNGTLYQEGRIEYK